MYKSNRWHFVSVRIKISNADSIDSCHAMKKWTGEQDGRNGSMSDDTSMQIVSQQSSPTKPRTFKLPEKQGSFSEPEHSERWNKPQFDFRKVHKVDF